jgi:hypothetical protein
MISAKFTAAQLFGALIVATGISMAHAPTLTGAPNTFQTRKAAKASDSRRSAPSETMPAPPVLWIERETIAPGKMETHNAVVRQILRQYERQHIAFHALGMTQELPDANEAMFLIQFNSFAEIDDFAKTFATSPEDFRKTMQSLEAQEDELHAKKQSMLAAFRPDLSYHADAAAMAKARMLWMCEFVVPTGRIPEYEADAKFAISISERAKLDQHFLVYQTVAGAESQTFIVLRPLRSFAEWDEGAAAARKIASTLDEAGKKRLAHIWKDQSVQGPGESVERLYFLRPDLSATPDKFAAFDPTFWHPQQ